MNKPPINYDIELNKKLQSWKDEGVRPKILIHGCCGPCSSTVLEKLIQYADITLYFYNPNIFPEEEYIYRALVQQVFIHQFNEKNKCYIKFVKGAYQPDVFYQKTREESDAPEGGKRCWICYRMRLEEAAKKAKELTCDYFATTLTLSPMKNSKMINQYGLEIQDIFSINYLPSDFKKNNGYARSILLSKEYEIYRQHYCGCIFAAQKQGIDLNNVKMKATQGISAIKEKFSHEISFDLT